MPDQTLIKVCDVRCEIDSCAIHNHIMNRLQNNFCHLNLKHNIVLNSVTVFHSLPIHVLLLFTLIHVSEPRVISQPV